MDLTSKIPKIDCKHDANNYSNLINRPSFNAKTKIAINKDNNIDNSKNFKTNEPINCNIRNNSSNITHQKSINLTNKPSSPSLNYQKSSDNKVISNRNQINRDLPINNLKSSHNTNISAGGLSNLDGKKCDKKYENVNSSFNPNSIDTSSNIIQTKIKLESQRSTPVQNLSPIKPSFVKYFI